MQHKVLQEEIITEEARIASGAVDNLTGSGERNA
jgi:hypothetical protein